MTQHHTPQAAPGRIEVQAAGRTWALERPADLEALWERMGEKDFGPDERLPYWVELWPAAVLLARFVAERAGEVRGRVCVDAGCGLGLSALVAASCGARVLAFDYEPEAVGFARRNGELNRAGRDGVLWTVMDWRQPALAAGAADLLLGADILYERRFFEPVAALLDHCLAPGGRAWIADPERSVSSGAWERLGRMGWRVSTPCTGRVAQGGQDMTVHIRELSRNL